MFDAAVLVRPLPKGSFYGLLAEHGDRIVRDEDFAECYSSGMGRPSIPPWQWMFLEGIAMMNRSRRDRGGP